MRKKKGCLLTAALCLMSVLGSSFSQTALGAVRTYSIEVDNHIRTGDVDISLEEYELDAHGEEIPYRDEKVVVPGQRVDKIVKIRNQAEPVWIRAGVEYQAEYGQEEMSDRMLGGMDDRWLKAGAYFYYTEPVNTEETVCLFRNFTVPPEWDEAENQFSLEVTAQAVQAANFVPDFQSESPWFGIPIEKCVHGSYETESKGEEQKFSVVFENGSEGFVKTGEDFFGNFSALMPGDTVEDSVEIGNRSSRDIDLYFRTEIPEQPGESLELLDQLRLSIRKGDRQIYDGPLNGKDLAQEILLAEDLTAGDEESLIYQIHMPEELTNSAALKSAGVRWIFRAEFKTVSGGSSGGGGSGGRPEKPEEVTFSQTPEQKELPVAIPDRILEFAGGLLPKTGERFPVELWCLMVTGGAMLVLAVLAGRKR